jgi:excisionase family DNA binding protein
MTEGWGKIKPAAEYCGVGERTFRSWLKKGLRHTRLPSGTVLIKFSHLDAFLEQYEVNSNEVDQVVDEILKSI